jgi:Ca-activated chloride channel family protein
LPPGAAGADRFGGNGIRKAVLLTRYADLLLNWISDARRGRPAGAPILVSVTSERGLRAPAPLLGEWERQSIPLAVPAEYRALFGSFLQHFKAEAAAIGDASLAREADLLAGLAQAPAIAAGP